MPRRKRAAGDTNHPCPRCPGRSWGTNKGLNQHFRLKHGCSAEEMFANLSSTYAQSGTSRASGVAEDDGDYGSDDEPDPFTAPGRVPHSRGAAAASGIPVISRR